MRSVLGKALLIFIVALLLYTSSFFVFPEVSVLQKQNPIKTSFMQYRQQEWEAQGKHIKISQTWVTLAHISPYLIKAVLIGEDDKFWRHEGFDFEAMQKALEKDIKKKRFKFGGSTVSQQLAKNLYLSPSKNPVRKIKEAILTWRLEKTLSKKRILELYLNVAEWGEGIFGIEAAARHYYGKSASALNPEEASRLASVLPNPIMYNPLGTSKYVENRSRLIYKVMVKRGIVSEEYEELTEDSGNRGTSTMEDRSGADGVNGSGNDVITR